MYRFLSIVYLHLPQPGLVRHITSSEVLTELSSLFGVRTVAPLRAFAATVGADGNVESLKQEYMDLFAVPTGRYVTPFEDVYRGITVEGTQERGPLLGERAIAVKRMYRLAGAELDRDCRELPTHVGVQLSFMSFLCERQAVAIAEEESNGVGDREHPVYEGSIWYRELQARFLREHLGVWLPQLRRAIETKARSDFYRGLALVTEEFLVKEEAALVKLSDQDVPAKARDWAGTLNQDRAE
jgi:TorA maturation chaperone TorD